MSGAAETTQRDIAPARPPVPPFSRLIKEPWAYEENRIAVRFAYEFHDDSGNWFRSYGNENWEVDENGLMRLRFDKAKFRASFAADVSAARAEFMAEAQVPWGVVALSTAISDPAWKTRRPALPSEK